MRGDIEILRAITVFFARVRNPRKPQPLIIGFIDQMRSEAHAVESTCRVLQEQGCQIAGQTHGWVFRYARCRYVVQTNHVPSLTSGRAGQATPSARVGSKDQFGQLRADQVIEVLDGFTIHWFEDQRARRSCRPCPVTCAVPGT